MMELSTLFDITNYLYIQVTLGIIVITMVVHKFFKPNVHPKWVTLIVALAVGVVHYFAAPEFDLWKLISSLGFAIMGYDYLVKVLKDRFSGKNPMS